MTGMPAFDGRLSDTGWITISFYPDANPWSQYGVGWDAQYRRKDGTVWLRGLVKKSAGSLATAITQLPAGFRPNLNNIYPIACASNTSAFMYVESNGLVYIGAGGSATWTSLSGISFPADQ